MAEKNKIAGLLPGVSFTDCIYLVKNVEAKSAKNGPYLQMLLSDASGQKTAKKWQATEDEESTALSAQFVLVSGIVENGQYKGDLRLNSLAAANEPLNWEGFLAPFPESHEENLIRFERLINSVQEPNLRGLLEKVFDQQKEIWPLYHKAHAAAKKHHAYPGGLLHHSVEVAELCASACDVVPGLSRDLLVASALLHDIGKLNEMDHGLNAGEYTSAGVLNGHISLGASRVRQFMVNIKGFPAPLKESVMHMILSHHGVVEYGSPVTPKFAEAQVLTQCDLISARVFEYSEAVKNANGKIFVWLSGKESVQVYTGDLGLQKVDVPVTLPVASEVFTTVPKPSASASPTFQTARLRVRGLVAAGSPDQGSAEDQETREVVPPACGADFLVRVTGDSMVDEGIRERDLLFVKVIETPKDGDIVVAHLGASGEVVKRFRFSPAKNLDSGRKWLESENSIKNYPDLPIDNDTRIRGKVVGLLRDF